MISTVGKAGETMAFPVRGLAPEVVDRLDAAAQAHGVSRNAYIVELLTAHASAVRPTVSRESFAEAAELAVDLGDEDVMRAAWS